MKGRGILFDSKLYFDKHFNYLSIKCNQLLGFRKFTNMKALFFLYNSLIRSTLEFGPVVWNPIYKV